MSKQVKQMQMDALAKAFGGVRDLVVFSASGIDATTAAGSGAATGVGGGSSAWSVTWVAFSACISTVMTEVGRELPFTLILWAG